MKKCAFQRVLALALVLITLVSLAVPAFAATYNYTVSGASQCTAFDGDILYLNNPQSSAEMAFYDYYWSYTGSEDCITLTDNGRNAIVEVVGAGTVTVCAELTGSIPVTNYGTRYNQATKRYESYTYITYTSRTYKSYLVITAYDDKPPAIASLPNTVITANGKTGSVALKATTGTGTSLRYQWYLKNAGQSKFSKSSVTSKTYSFSMSDKSNGRQVYCIVTDGNGKSTKSETVTLKMAAPITIKTQPKTVSVAAGNVAKTSVTATGEGTLKYQWYVKNPGKTSFSKSSITSRTYSARIIPSNSGRQVYCVVSDAYGQKVQTKTVTLKMNNTLSIYSEPESTTVVYGKTASATVKANGSGTLKYQWYVKNPGKTSFSKSSVTKATYSTTMKAAADGRKAYCVITDATGAKVTSDTITFTGIPKLKITSQPKDTMVASSATAKASVRVTGGSGVKYQWFLKDPGQTDFTDAALPDADWQIYSVSMTKSISGRQVYCVITDNYGQKVTSDTVTLRMAAPITITQRPQNTWQVAGKSVNLTVNATGEGTLKYQWYVKNVGSSSFSKSSITGPTYSFTMKEAADGRQLYCVITDNYGQQATTNTVTLHNDPPIVITTPLKDTSYKEPFIIEFQNDDIVRTIKWYLARPGGAFWCRSTSSAKAGNKLTIYNNGSIADAEDYIYGSVYCVISDSSGQSIKSNVAKILP